MWRVIMLKHVGCCKGLNGVCVWHTQPCCRYRTYISLQLSAQVSHVKLHCRLAIITRFFAEIHFLNTAAARTDNTIHQNNEVLLSFVVHCGLQEWLSISISVKFLLITNLMHFFMCLFIHFISLHVSSIKCSSSGDRIVLIHHLVWLVCVSDCLVCRSGSLLTSIPSSHLHRLIIPDDVLIQFDLLMMSTWSSKHVERWNEYIINKYMKKCIRLVINNNLWRDARSTKYKLFH